MTETSTPPRNPQPAPQQPRSSRRLFYVAIAVASSLATIGVAYLVTDIFQHKIEATKPYVRVVEVGENDTDPAVWGRNWPAQYSSYKLTAERTKTRFGGHGGSEALPEEKIQRDKWLERMFRGYAFSIDYRDRRGHALELGEHFLHDLAQCQVFAVALVRGRSIIPCLLDFVNR